MPAIHSINKPLDRHAPEHDPFLRKNQTWFHQPLPPSIERPLLANRKIFSQNHLDSTAGRILDPHAIERKQLVPRRHVEHLKTLHDKIRALGNQKPEAEKLAHIIQSEISLVQEFYAERVSATPC